MDNNLRKRIDEFASHFRPVMYKKGQIITLGGNEPKGVAFLQEGVVEQYDITAEGNKITVNIFKPPAFFPMSWAMNGTLNEYCFEAMSDAVLRYADPSDAVAFLRENPDVTFDLLGRVYRGTDALLKRIVLAASGAATNRLIFELLIEGYRFGYESDGGTITIAVQQHALASRTGLARETVSRELHKLEKLRLVSLSREGIAISLQKLESYLADHS